MKNYKKKRQQNFKSIIQVFVFCFLTKKEPNKRTLHFYYFLKNIINQFSNSRRLFQLFIDLCCYTGGICKCGKRSLFWVSKWGCLIYLSSAYWEWEKATRQMNLVKSSSDAICLEILVIRIAISGVTCLRSSEGSRS